MKVKLCYRRGDDGTSVGLSAPGNATYAPGGARSRSGATIFFVKNLVCWAISRHHLIV